MKTFLSFFFTFALAFSAFGQLSVFPVGGGGSGGTATNVIWPIAGTNTTALTNGLTVQIDVPTAAGDVTKSGQNNFSGSNYFGSSTTFGAPPLGNGSGLTNLNVTTATGTKIGITNNGVYTLIDSNTITSSTMTLSGTGTNYFGANVNVNGTVNATGYTNSGYLVSTAGTNYLSSLEGPLQIWNDQYHTNGSYRWSGGIIHSNALGTTRQSSGSITNSGVVVATNGFSSRSNVFTLFPTNPPTDGQVMTATGTAGDTAWKAAAAGGGGGTVSNAAALTSGQFVIGGGNGAVSTTLDGSALTNVMGFARLFANTGTCTVSGNPNLARISNYVSSYINNNSKFAVDAANGYITNLVAGVDLECGFQSEGTQSTDIQTVLFTNDVSTAQFAAGICGVSRGVFGTYVIPNVAANTRLCIQAWGSGTQATTNFAFWARQIPK